MSLLNKTGILDYYEALWMGASRKVFNIFHYPLYQCSYFYAFWPDGEVELLLIDNDFGVVVSVYFSLFENGFVSVS